jgi:hypothetical protein
MDSNESQQKEHAIVERTEKTEAEIRMLRDVV